MANVSDQLWHPWPRIRRLLREMLALSSDAEAWRQVKPEIRKALSEQRRVERAGWFVDNRSGRWSTRSEPPFP